MKYVQVQRQIDWKSNTMETIDILGKETKPQPNTPIIEIYFNFKCRTLYL